MLRLHCLALMISAFSLVCRAWSVVEALRLADASVFADYVNDNPAILARLSDPTTKTIYAPNDDSMKKFLSNATYNRRLVARQNYLSSAAYLAYSKIRKTAQDLETAPGTSTDVGDDGATVASTPPPPSQNVRRAQNTTVTRAVLYSGLGRSVRMVKGDTPFANGLIHTTDG